MEQDYELEDEYAPRVLWGRIAFFLIALALAFWLGTCTGDEGVPQSEFNELSGQVVELSSENEVLRQQLDAAGQDDEQAGDGDGGGDGDQGGEEQATETDGEDGGDGGEDGEAVGQGETYEVQSGDTLTRIAEEFYGDPRKFDLIVDANNLDSETGLRVGQELIIPPDD